ncbi:MAG: PHP domain-containing protein [Armatimonadetes bacterium]|nr:PHP domain-containing protein [Anaerolineae bacterium]
MLNVDMHSHTLWSTDSVTTFETIMALCRKRGIQRLCVTDHNTADGALAFQQVAPDLVIVGEEIMTTQGELLAYFVRESVPQGLTPQETIQRLRQQGAVISVAHPFDRLRKGAWDETDLLAILDQVDAIEIFNARCVYPEDNDKALAFAQQHNILGTIGSDAHIRPEYGRAYGVLREFAHDPEDFLDALRQADYLKRLSPAWVHGGSSLAKWSKKVGLRPRLWSGG